MADTAVTATGTDVVDAKAAAAHGVSVRNVALSPITDSETSPRIPCSAYRSPSIPFGATPPRTNIASSARSSGSFCGIELTNQTATPFPSSSSWIR